jgi:hypothetical protein
MSAAFVVTLLVVTLSDTRHVRGVDIQNKDVIVCCDNDVEGSISGGGDDDFSNEDMSISVKVDVLLFVEHPCVELSLITA